MLDVVGSRFKFDDNQPLRAGSNQNQFPGISLTASAGQDYATITGGETWNVPG